MTIQTLLVHLELGRANEAVLTSAQVLAARFNAKVIGIAASQPMQILYAEVYAAGDLLKLDRDQIAAEMDKVEGEFRAAIPADRILDWRALLTHRPLAEAIAEESRSADLIITGPDIGGAPFESTRRTVVGNLVMGCGRPVLIAPATPSVAGFDHVMLAWRDTREARRAALDGLPFMRAASEVSVVEIAPEVDLPDARRRVEDVSAWLSRHGVNSIHEVVTAHHSDASRLIQVAKAKDANLVIAGAYGHARLREWIFGGVTYDLLLRPMRSVLLSH